ncbi:MAG: hypothetical protein A2040_06830 [Rhodocyclales bacterium GWA2_65_19]|nr:MAG: hypothetical protein A2040_06830 [Rhodocyclales bacterium GWA2_65_19]
MADCDGRALGVLALVFHLTDEMRGIFRHLLPAGDWTVLACATAEGQVIASSSSIQVPVGAELPPAALGANGEVLRFGGREYLAVACRTRGYQGYQGPGWLGVGLLPLEFAFDRDDSVLLANVDRAILDRVMRQPTLFAAMLTDALPRDDAGQVVENSFAVFIDAASRVLASSSEAFAIGAAFPVAAGAGAGGGTRILAIAGRHYAVGAAHSAGYREFKCSDGYRNHVTALCGFPLGDAGAALPAAPRAAVASSNSRRSGDGGAELATFHIGQRWLAVPTTHVLEAVDSSGLTPPTGAEGDVVAGFRLFRDKLITVLRLDRLIAGTRESDIAEQQIVVVRTHNKHCLGLLVDALGEISDVARDDIQGTLEMNAAPGVLVTGIVRNMRRDGEGDSLLSVLDVERLCGRLGCRGCQEQTAAA